ncbi:putative olfactory receptor 52P1 [Ornithorhynchus anatinus]|uniref:putative olfactory receptor 52P1 n=1 Tax=Ornithorhynchus anatinus TaxID=9258 RepID=UPI0010A83433|nr:putative olfactory receptor 52P1 [Ornithorhynchus anatinus]
MVENISDFGFPSLFLVGIPNLGRFHVWFGFPVCFIYILTLLGNCLLVLMIKTESSLHQPMYFFLCMLALNDMAISSSTAPKMLSIFWWNVHGIDFDSCLTQMYFIHTFSIIESALLLSMAFDRYIAICYPLRYSTILTNRVVIQMGLIGAARGILMVLPCPLLIKRLTYCTQNVIHHSYCEHMALVKLACSDTLVNRVYGICVALSVMVVDLGLIAGSYVKILQAVFRLSSKEARSKALGTCIAHICAILVSYLPALFSFLTHRIGRKVPAYIHTIIASIYLLVPPALNPLVYGVKTKQIRDHVIDFFFLKRILKH